MKKVLAVFIIGLSLGTAGAFADHPDGWGVGVLGRGGYGWGGGVGLGGFAFSLKAPQLPIFWGINFGFGNHYWGIGVTGDYYKWEGILAPDVGEGLGYFIGFGGFLGFGGWQESWWNGNKRVTYHRTDIEFGARGVIGLNVIIPLAPVKLEAFVDLAPSLGLVIHTYDNEDWRKAEDYNYVGLGGGVAGELGIRVWF